LGLAAFDRVRPDAKRLDERELIEVKYGGTMELARRERENRPHPAVGVDAQNLYIGATVGLAPAARDAFAAIDIGFDRAAVAGFEPVRIVARLDHFDGKLVPEHPRVTEEGLAAGKRMQVGPAYADTVDAHEGVAGLANRFSRIHGGKFSGLFENDLEHVSSKN
jgi:hypothetical protein